MKIIKYLSKNMFKVMKPGIMLTTISITSILTGLIFITEQQQAYAWFNICNRTNKKVEAIFGYQDNLDNRNGVSKNAPWVSKGKFNIKPGKCSRVYGHELWRRNSYYYYYAKSADGVWSGKNKKDSALFCVSTSSKFRIVETALVRKKCGNGRDIVKHFPGGRVRDAELGILHTIKPHYKTIAEDTEWLKLKKVYIGRGRVQNYTLNLR